MNCEVEETHLYSNYLDEERGYSVYQKKEAQSLAETPWT
jgi:hypothetical protein